MQLWVQDLGGTAQKLTEHSDMTPLRVRWSVFKQCEVARTVTLIVQVDELPQASVAVKAMGWSPIPPNATGTGGSLAGM